MKWSLNIGILLVTWILPACPGSDEQVAEPLPVPAPTESTLADFAGGSEPFRPPSYEEDGRTVLPVTFLEGSMAELVYDSSLRLEEARIQAFGSLEGMCEGDLTAFRGTPLEGRGEVSISSSAPVEMVRGPGGTRVEIWGVTGYRGGRYHVVYGFGEWTTVAHAASLPEARRCAQRLSGSEVAGGWLVLETRQPMELAPAGAFGGPYLWFVDVTPDPETHMQVYAARCDPGAEPVHEERFASWCEAGIQILVDGDPGFIDRLHEDLDIRSSSSRSR